MKEVEKYLSIKIDKLKEDVEFMLDEVEYFKKHINEENKKYILEDISIIRVDLKNIRYYLTTIYCKERRN